MATEAQKKARNKHNSKNQITKTIGFYKNTEKEMIDHIEKLNMPFGSYVKELIKKDIENK